MKTQNVVERVLEAARRVPDRPALVFRNGRGNVTLTYASLWDRIDRVCAGLAAEGLAPGDRVIVMIPMSANLYALLLGVLKLGAVAVFVDPWIERRQIAAFAAFAEPRAFAGIPGSHLLRGVDARLRRIPLSITTGRRLGPWPAHRTLREIEREPGDGRVREVGADDPALITFTSGSSGVPKGANRTHGFLAAQHAALSAEFPHEDSDVDMPTFPVFALDNLACGIPSIVPRMDFRRVAAVDAGIVSDQMRSCGVTTCTASPPFFDRLAEHRAENPAARHPLRRILTGGAPVTDVQLERWQRSFEGTEIVVAYGSTEAEPVARVSAAERLRAVSDVRPRAPGFLVGRPTARVRARTIAITEGPVELPAGGWSELECAPGEIGELVVSGDHVCRGYFRNEDAFRENKIVEPDGTVWHRMGDTGYFDGQERFWLAGRVHSSIRRGSEWLHPQLVEQAAAGVDRSIRRVAVLAVRDRGGADRVTVVLEGAPGDGVRTAVRARLHEAGMPVDDVVAVDWHLPVDPRHNSKIDYRRLRARLERHA
jgi:acyl-CoA synthetase (AMP-forming)/AMP-acid ligase II